MSHHKKRGGGLTTGKGRRKASHAGGRNPNRRKDGKRGRDLPTAEKMRGLFDASNTPARVCGACTMCCTTLAVHEIGKPGNHRCEHERRRTSRHKAGCAVYAERPAACGFYRCGWLDGLFAKGDRPDKVGLLVDVVEGVLPGLSRLAGFNVVCVREAWPGAHRSHRFTVLMAGLCSRVGVLYRGAGFPPFIAPTPEKMSRLAAASAVLDAASLAFDEHLEGGHSGGSERAGSQTETTVGNCPLCQGFCPVHQDQPIPECRVCQGVWAARGAPMPTPPALPE